MISNIKPSVRGQGGCSNLEKDNKKELDALKTRVDDLEGKVAENTEKLDAPDISKNTGTFKTINTDVLTSGKTQSGEVIADILKTDRIAKKTVDTLDIEHENINTKTVNAETLNVTNLNAKTANLPGNMSFDNIAAKNIDSDVVDAAVVDVDDLTVLNRMSDLGVDNLDTTNVNVAEKVTAKQAEFKEAITAVTAQIDDIVSKNITSENTKTTFADITNAEIDEARLNTLYAAGHKGNYSVSIPETLSPLDLVIFNVPLVNGYYIVKNEEFSISFFINKSADTDTRPAIFYQLKQKVVGTVPEVRVGVDGNLYFSYARQKEDISLVNFAFVDLDETLDGMLKVTMVDWPEEALYDSYPESYCNNAFMAEKTEYLKVEVQGRFSAMGLDLGDQDIFANSLFLKSKLGFQGKDGEYPVLAQNTYDPVLDTSTFSITGAKAAVLGETDKPTNLTITGDTSSVGNMAIGSKDLPASLDISGNVAIGDDVNFSTLTVAGDTNIGTKEHPVTLNVVGDIIQNGENYATHAEQVLTKNANIILREGATLPLGPGELSGIKAEHYDDEGNTGVLAFDKTGTARVGDAGKEQPIATRLEKEDMKDNNVVVWKTDHLEPATKATKPVIDDLTVATENQLSDGSVTVVSDTATKGGVEIATLESKVANADKLDDIDSTGFVQTGNVAQTVEGTKTFTGQVKINGTAAAHPLIVRGVVGSDGEGTADDLYLQYGANKKVLLGNAGAGVISADGLSYNGTAANADQLDSHDSTYFAVDKDVVKLEGTQTVNGAKSFTDMRITNAPSPADGGNLPFILGIQSFKEGGNVMWQTPSNVSVGSATNATHANDLWDDSWEKGKYMRPFYGQSDTNPTYLTSFNWTEGRFKPVSRNTLRVGSAGTADESVNSAKLGGRPAADYMTKDSSVDVIEPGGVYIVNAPSREDAEKLLPKYGQWTFVKTI